MSRVGELVENVPGVIATQHSGTGKANQYFLRGFNLDHGTDFAAFVDGVPVNMRSHGHGQGYLDLNFLIPELVERIDYRKGPYFADVGDFSAAGTVMFKTMDRLQRPVAVRACANGSLRFAPPAQLAADDTALIAIGRGATLGGSLIRLVKRFERKYSILGALTGRNAAAHQQKVALGHLHQFLGHHQRAPLV